VATATPPEDAGCKPPAHQAHPGGLTPLIADLPQADFDDRRDPARDELIAAARHNRFLLRRHHGVPLIRRMT
jgi:hypothetical protein